MPQKMSMSCKPEKAESAETAHFGIGGTTANSESDTAGTGRNTAHCTAVTKSQLHILFHSLGLDDNGRGHTYRNYYCDQVGGCPDIKALVALGLMEAAHTINEGRDQYFLVSDGGKALALKSVKPEPKRTRSQLRYRDFLNADCGLTFGEWLKCKRRTA